MLVDIRQRPTLYLGAKTITGLYHFLAGYQFAFVKHNMVGNMLALPEDIRDWVAYRLQFKEPTLDWHSMILAKIPAEADAFDYFFELLDEHATRVPCIRAKLRGIRHSYTATSNGVSRTLNYPHTVSLVTYTEDPGFFVYSDDPETDFPRRPFFPSLGSLLNWLDADRADLDIVDAHWAQQQ